MAVMTYPAVTTLHMMNKKGAVVMLDVADLLKLW